MKRHPNFLRLLATLGAAMLLFACAAPDSDEVVVTLIIATAPMEVMPAAGATTPVATVAPDTPFAGPPLLYFLENTYEESYLGLFDPATGAFRELPGSLGVYLNEAQWVDDGCGLFVRGQVLNLMGSAGWAVPAEVAAAVPDFAFARLSPDRRWLAHLLPGDQGLDVEVIALTPPYDRLRLTAKGGADGRALAWAPDSSTLYFGDRDAEGIVQLYRAAPDGNAIEPLTAHDRPGKIINAIAPSPDGRRLAYGVRTGEVLLQPYRYDPADEGWIGLIDLETGAQAIVNASQLGAVEDGRGLWWSAAGDRLLAVGDSLPIASDEPLAGRRAHWIAADGTIARSFHQADGPGGQVGWVAPLRDFDTLLFAGPDGIYTWADGRFERVPPERVPPVGQTMDRRVIGLLPAPLTFPGEANCPAAAP